MVLGAQGNEQIKHRSAKIFHTKAGMPRLLQELSASGASPSGVSISAHWASTGLPTQLQVQSQYWLEKWQDDIACYVSFDGGQFRAEVPQLLPETTCSWYISWKNTCGILESGQYRVGMIFCEEYNGNIQNETTCYAKFSITETN